MSKDWKGNKKSTFTTLGASSHSEGERAEHDFYATEPLAIDKLFGIKDLCLSGYIWEPACGNGHLVKRMEELRPKIDVYATDLVVRDFPCKQYDFLSAKDHEDLWARDIITNPPYSLAEEFVRKALNIIENSYKVCMFLKLTFLEGQKRRLLFDEHPPMKVYVSSQRLKCAKNGDFENTGSSAAAYAWFVWQQGNKTKTEIEWI